MIPTRNILGKLSVINGSNFRNLAMNEPFRNLQYIQYLCKTSSKLRSRGSQLRVLVEDITTEFI